LLLLTDSTQGIYSKKTLDANNNDLRKLQVAPGSGPFMFKEYKAQVSMTFVRNPDYKWGPALMRNQGAPYLDQVTYRFVLVGEVAARDEELVAAVHRDRGPEREPHAAAIERPALEQVAARGQARLVRRRAQRLDARARDEAAPSASGAGAAPAVLGRPRGAGPGNPARQGRRGRRGDGLGVGGVRGRFTSGGARARDAPHPAKAGPLQDHRADRAGDDGGQAPGCAPERIGMPMRYYAWGDLSSKETHDATAATAMAAHASQYPATARPVGKSCAAACCTPMAMAGSAWMAWARRPAAG